MYNYIALFTGLRVEGKNVVEMERLEYAFHTFSLRNECAYEPTSDVTFASINPDAESLVGGVERMVSAVLLIDVTAVVLHSEDLRTLIDEAKGDMIEVAPGFTRSRVDLEALYDQSLETHHHEH